MRTNFIFSITISLFALLGSGSNARPIPANDSVVLGGSYKNEAYYNMAGGLVLNAPRATWDIAFRTLKLSAAMITNDGSGVILYTYPKSDTSGWATVDTANMTSWKPLYNDPSDWENGAFNRYSYGMFDYGWGVYNISTHNLTGDSLYVIKLRDGSMKKLWIVGKQSAANIYTFRFANINGTNEQNVVLDLNPFVSMDFYGYSLKDAGEGVAFQPAKSQWDILFTRYMSIQPNGTPYPVVGVLSNDTVSSKKFHPVDLAYSDFGAGEWDSTRSSIGWDWKYFDNQSFSYIIEDSTVYFVQQKNGDKYKLIFTAFAGSGSGLIKFNVSKAAGAGVNEEMFQAGKLKVYPNPASDVINIPLPVNTNEPVYISLSDLSSRQLCAVRLDNPDRSGVYPMNVTGVQPGIYFVTVSTAASKITGKILINR